MHVDMCLPFSAALFSHTDELAGSIVTFCMQHKLEEGKQIIGSRYSNTKYSTRKALVVPVPVVTVPKAPKSSTEIFETFFLRVVAANI